MILRWRLVLDSEMSKNEMVGKELDTDQLRAATPRASES